MLEVLQPLGLQAVRLQAVWGLAHDFLAADWQSPSDFKHCGPFVADSWRIFCRGGGSLAGVGDKNLQRYLRWRLHGKVEEAGKRERAAGSRKRRASPPAEAGTLRSGRRRNGTAGGSGGGGAQASPPGQRRMTRAAGPSGTGAATSAPKAARGRRS